ncbi:MAG: tellurium resistance protein TerC [Gammaproteobacteria bacterium]|nr:tellurium resistance protein TerC [Gammaproteobacteria bacterium]
MLVMLQAVLGFDNLLYISLESKRVEPHRQASIRRLGIGLAVALRIILLFVVVKVLDLFQDPFFAINIPQVIEATFNLHSVIVLIGGVFIIYTAINEITHMLVLEELGHNTKAPASFAKTLALVVVMNAVFSFDSILSAMALTDVFLVMALAIIIGGVLMIWLADHVAEFLEKNRMYEVVGLFILFIVGIMLLADGGHLSHLKLAGYAIEPMSKSTFYFVIGIVVLVEIVQGRYRSNLLKKKAAQQVSN